MSPSTECVKQQQIRAPSALLEQIQIKEPALHVWAPTTSTVEDATPRAPTERMPTHQHINVLRAMARARRAAVQAPISARLAAQQKTT